MLTQTSADPLVISNQVTWDTCVTHELSYQSQSKQQRFSGHLSVIRDIFKNNK